MLQNHASNALHPGLLTMQVCRLAVTDSPHNESNINERKEHAADSILQTETATARMHVNDSGSVQTKHHIQHSWLNSYSEHIQVKGGLVQRQGSMFGTHGSAATF